MFKSSHKEGNWDPTSYDTISARFCEIMQCEDMIDHRSCAHNLINAMTDRAFISFAVVASHIPLYYAMFQ